MKKTLPKNGVKVFAEYVAGWNAYQNIHSNNSRIFSEEDAKELVAIRKLVPNIERAKELLRIEKAYKYNIQCGKEEYGAIK